MNKQKQATAKEAEKPKPANPKSPRNTKSEKATGTAGQPRLAAYHAKRTFSRTSEPEGKASSFSAEQQLMFVVQRHAASHLHYDFRLELDGVLKSWAVPKGPSMNPGDKRLAMEVEDHPLEYGSFEGTIPKGNYGAGEVRIWDRGFYHSSQVDIGSPEENIKALRRGLEKGHLDFVLFGEQLKGRFALIRIQSPQKGKNAWLLIKQKDDFASNKGPDNMPREVRPMLARLEEEPFDREGWFFEIKWDGYRAIAEIEDEKVSLYSRNGLSFVQKFPSIVEALKHVKQNMVLDGEIVAIKDGRPDFHALQNFDEQPAPIQFVAFDLLFAEGRDLRRKPLRERKDMLKSLLPRHPLIVYNDHIEKDGIAFYNELKKIGMEGMVAKNAASPYVEGSRNGDWVKIKIKNTQEAVICGFTAPRGSRKKMGALILGAYDKGKLKYIGHSGGGFTEKELDDIHSRLVELKTLLSPFEETVKADMPITWVKPEVVCEIHFTEWTPDGRLRHPIFMGLRLDKNPEEVFKEQGSDKAKINESATETKARGNPKQAVAQKANRFTNLGKVFWPEDGFTKGDVIAYYDGIADFILPHLKDRPESLNRHPNGIDGPHFFHKDMTTEVPEFAETISIYSDTNEKEICFLLCQNKETLLYLANLGCIEINPWLSRRDNLDNPDYIIIDLDPGGASFSDLITTANKVHEVLQKAGVKCYVKTSGKSGFHIAVPFAGAYTYDQAKGFSELVARMVHRQLTEITSIERIPSKRGNKVYVDYLQNRKGQTIAAPYSLRPCPGATVSTPLDWQEVTYDLNPKTFTIKNSLERAQKYGDLWKPVLEQGFDMLKALQALHG